MKWQRGRRSDNVLDRRRMSTGKKVAGGGLGIVAISLIAMFLGVDPQMVSQIAGGLTGGGSTQKQSAPRSAEEEAQAEFVKVVLADTEDTWNPIFKKLGRQYREPKLVMFTGATSSACGHAQSAMGPFYCPGDQMVYIDLAFYKEMKHKFGAPGDFAQAYVVAHEVGHHVQTLLGISEKVQRAKQGASQVEANAIQVRMELQADCFSGVWANRAHTNRQLLEPGDLEEGLNAAAAIGDDTLQRKAQGHVVPESFTHGSAAQRQTWFVAGLKAGDISACDTFSGSI